MDYGFKVLQPGQKLKFAVATEVSRLFNGEEDLNGFMSAKDEIERIKKIADGMNFHPRERSSRDLEVVDLAQDPAYSDLVQACKANIDPKTGTVDVTKAFGFEEGKTPELAEKPTALQLAKFLYWISEINDDFAEDVFNMRPERLKKSEIESTKYYGLFEVAQRLKAAISGEIYHGGADRQGKPDTMIQRLIKGKHGGYGHIKELEPLFKVLGGTRFETLHVDSKDNYYRNRAKKVTAQTRLLVYGALGLATSFGLVNKVADPYFEQKADESAEADADAYIKDKLNDTYFSADGGKWSIDKSHNLSIFKEMIKKVTERIVERYQIDGKVLRSMKKEVAAFLLQNVDSLRSAYGQDYYLDDLADLFVESNKFYLKLKGVDVPPVPYPRLLPYAESLMRTAEMPDIVEMGDFVPKGGNRYAVDLGRFNGPETDETYHLYDTSAIFDLVEVNDPNFGYLIEARKNFYDRPLELADFKDWMYLRYRINGFLKPRTHEAYNLEDGKKAGKAYVNMLMRWSTLPLSHFHDKMREYEGCNVPMDIEVEPRTYDLSGSPFMRFTDPFGRFDYEFDIRTDWTVDRKAEEEHYYLVARHKNNDNFCRPDDNFSTTVTYEALRMYNLYRYHRYDENLDPARACVSTEFHGDYVPTAVSEEPGLSADALAKKVCEPKLKQ